MRDKYFLDSNIFIYSLDKSAPQKREVAFDLIANALEKMRGCTSYQVVQEVGNVAVNKFQNRITQDELVDYCTNILFVLNDVPSSNELVLSAIEIKEKYRFSFYDALIIASAQQANCDVLYTEDMQHLQKIGSLQIINPFL